jgi:hypothetical protein
MRANQSDHPIVPSDWSRFIEQPHHQKTLDSNDEQGSDVLMLYVIIIMMDYAIQVPPRTPPTLNPNECDVDVLKGE